jgi:hypothetical protein
MLIGIINQVIKDLTGIFLYRPTYPRPIPDKRFDPVADRYKT